MTSNIHALFHVPEGLEHVAARDIEESIKDKLILQESTYNWEKKTGRVHLFGTVKGVSEFRSYIQQVELRSVYSVMLVAAETIIPIDTFNEADPTCQFISHITQNGNWETLFGKQAERATFRATFKKGALKHKVPSQEIAGYIGAAFGELYDEWKVKMTGFDYEIMGIWFQSDNVEWLKRLSVSDQSIILLLGLNIPIEDQKYRNRLFFGRTSLNPCIAYCLAMIAQPRPGQIVLDMCCGTGTIPIEGASRFPNTFWLGGEVKVKTLAEKGRGNVLHANLQNVDLLLSDGRKMCLRDGTVDTIVSDWPWGLRENSFQQIQGLYPKFMKQMWRVLQPKGKAYIVTQGNKLMHRVLKYDWCQRQWKVDDIVPIGIGGYDVYLFILSKCP